jgi:hypothetical protein
MRNENELDKLFRERLGEAEEDAPMHLWPAVNKATTKRKRGGWIISFILLGVIGFFIAQNVLIDHYSNTKPQAVAPDETKSDPANAQPEPDIENYSSAGTTQNRNTPDKSDGSTPSNESNDLQEANSDHLNAGTNNTNTPLPGSKNPTKNKLDADNTASNHVGRNSSGQDKQSTHGSKQNDSSSSSSVNGSDSDKSDKAPASESNNNMSNQTNGNITVHQDKGLSGQPNTQSNSATFNAMLALAENRPANLLESVMPNATMLATPKPVKFDFNTKTFFSLEPYALVGQTGRRYMEPGSASQSAFGEQTEHGLLLGGGLALKTSFKPWMNVSLGAEFVTYSELQSNSTI